jgi:hypothetical protein
MSEPSVDEAIQRAAGTCRCNSARDSTPKIAAIDSSMIAISHSSDPE